MGWWQRGHLLLGLLLMVLELLLLLLRGTYLLALHVDTGWVDEHVLVLLLVLLLLL